MGAAHGCFIYLTKLHLKVSQSLLTQEVLSCEWYRVRYWMGREPYRGEGSGERGEGRVGLYQVVCGTVLRFFCQTTKYD